MQGLSRTSCVSEQRVKLMLLEDPEEAVERPLLAIAPQDKSD